MFPNGHNRMIEQGQPSMRADFPNMVEPGWETMLGEWGLDPAAFEGRARAGRRELQEAKRRLGPERGFAYFDSLLDDELTDYFHHTVFPNVTITGTPEGSISSEPSPIRRTPNGAPSIIGSWLPKKSDSPRCRRSTACVHSPKPSMKIATTAKAVAGTISAISSTRICRWRWPSRTGSTRSDTAIRISAAKKAASGGFTKYLTTTSKGDAVRRAQPSLRTGSLPSQSIDAALIIVNSSGPPSPGTMISTSPPGPLPGST